SGRRAARVAAPLAALLLLGAVLPSRLPELVVDGAKTLGEPGAQREPPFVSRWSPVFRVDVSRSPFPGIYVLSHDGMWGSILTKWDADLASLDRFDHDPRAYPFRLLGAAPRVAIIGAAGGGEILAALHFDAGDITAVELNPVSVSLLRDDFAEFTGHLATQP